MENQRALKITAITLGTLIAACLLWAYIAGTILLPLIKLKASDATLLTWYQYWTFYPELRPKQLAWSGWGALALIVSPALLLLTGQKRSLFGDAKWATNRQITDAGFNAVKGILVGVHARTKKYLVFGGQQHVLLGAPTRSGKGVGIVIPNLLNWPDSVVVLDIKQENYDITAGFRAANGQAVYLFNPADYRTHRYNPLSYINPDPNRAVDDIQKIASMLFPDLPGVDPIWNASCRSLFLGIVLYLTETPERPTTIGEVLRCTLTRTETSKYFKTIIDEREAAGNPLSAICVLALSDFISVTSENTRSSIKKTFTSRLELWQNPIIDAATSESDFDLRDLRKKRMSLYIGITPDNLDRLQPLINLLCQQIIDLNTRELPQQNPALKYTCLMLLDEFTAIGKIGVLAKGISYVAGYNLRLLVIIQSMSQLRDTYGVEGADTFSINHALHIIFAPRTIKIAEEISNSLGFETVKGVSLSKAKSLFGKKDPSVSISDQKRALLLPQEVIGIGPKAEILLLEGTPPIAAKKIIYYNDPTFKKRLMKAPTVPTHAVLQAGSPIATPTQNPAGGELLPPSREPVEDTKDTLNTYEAAHDKTDLTMPADALQLALANYLEENPEEKDETSETKPDKAKTLHDLNTIFDASTLDDDPFAEKDPFAEPPAETKPAETKKFRIELNDISLDFDDVEVPIGTISNEQLEELHAVFLGKITETN